MKRPPDFWFKNQIRLCRFPIEGETILVPQDLEEEAKYNSNVMSLTHYGYLVKIVPAGTVDIEPPPPEPDFHYERKKPEEDTSIYYRILSTECELIEHEVRGDVVVLRYVNRDKQDITTNKLAIEKMLKMQVWHRIEK